MIRLKANVKLKRETSRGQTVNCSKMLNFETSIAIVGLMYSRKHPFGIVKATIGLRASKKFHNFSHTQINEDFHFIRESLLFELGLSQF